ncbi:concanavalin A-like lectin/glucanase domain-containing protein [Delphinella strobiligena]|nr:concanavalin A-like lectin/glucanase domain-containing protein [Delphinella strobiligena]
MQLCEIYNGATTDSGTYLYGTNQWGNDGSGSQCIYVELDDDSTKAASFNATWSWTNNSVWVHSYPNVQYQSIQLPTQLSNVKSFQLNASWSVWPSDDYSATTDIAALTAIGTKADIALDMFLDSDSTTASNASAAEVEVMVWGAVWGGVWPIGYYEPTTGAPEYNTSTGVTYQLFVGQNQQGQKQTVYSWVPTSNLDSIEIDVYDLIQMVISAGNITDTMYLGVIQFGTETVHATSNVTTEFKSIYMDLEVNSAKPTPTSSKGSSSATSTSKGGAMGLMPTITSFAYPVAMGLAAVLAL